METSPEKMPKGSSYNQDYRQIFWRLYGKIAFFFNVLITEQSVITVHFRRELSDVTRDGQLNLNEFIAACKLIQMKLRGYNVPPALPPPLLNLVKNESKITIDFTT